MKREYIPQQTRQKVLERDEYTCNKCDFHKIFTIKDVPKHYKTDWHIFLIFKSLVVNSVECKVLEFKDNGGRIEDIVFNWLSPAGLEIDHIIPVCLGGTNDENNLQTLCRECHIEKSYHDGS